VDHRVADGFPQRPAGGAQGAGGPPGRGPPCQGFSSAGRRRKGDPRNELVERYLEFVDLVLPRMVLIENVRGITHDFVGDEASDRHNFADELAARLGANYHVYTDIVRCASLGVPQHRPRFFLVGMLKSQFKKLPRRDSPFAMLRSSKVRFLEQRGLRSTITCVSAWKKDPVRGVIGVQSGPLW
jgi:DNA (cytosine-5)-methyltransferase 1